MSVYDCPTRITLSGQVLAIQRDIHTFVMTIRQQVGGAPHKRRLKIHALLGFNPLWPHTQVCLLVKNKLVSFTGDFLAFESSVALVGLDDIAFIERLFLENQDTVTVNKMT